MAKATQKPLWLKMSEEDLKKVIKELADKYQPAQIGIILRDQYGVPSTKVFGKKLGAYLKELGIEADENLTRAEKKAERLAEHFKENVTDMKAKHKLQKAQTRANILRKYSKRKKK
jgi:small subunit ribosomal protein S15